MAPIGTTAAHTRRTKYRHKSQVVRIFCTLRPAQPSSLSWFPTSYMRKNIHNSDYFWPVPHLPRSTLGPASSLLPSPPCHSTPPNIAGHREAKMSSKSFLRSGFKYISQLLGLFFSHLCLFVCQSCLSVCLSVCTLSRMFDFCFVCHHSAAAWASSPAHSASGEESFSCSSVPHRLQLCLSLFPMSVRILHCLSVCLSKRTRRPADTVGSNWEPAAALGSFSRKPGLPGGNRATGGTAPSHRLVRPRLLPS